MTGAAIAAWHDALTPGLAAESGEWLREELRKRGLFFGDRALCSVIRPRFLSRAQHAVITSQVPILLGALQTALDAAIVDPRVLDQFRLEPWERTLALEDPGINATPLTRLDAFFSPGDGVLRVTEYNGECPAGPAYNDALTKLFLALPVVRSFRHRFALTPLPARPNTLHSLLDAYQQYAGNWAKPTIGILDWSEVPTMSEFLLFQDYFSSLGYTCIIGDPRHCEYRDGRLYVDGVAIDLIYKRILITELVERGGLDHPIVRAVRDRAVCMVNPFRCKILHKKASLAVLSDERNGHLFTAAQQEAIATHVPWTRMVEERTTRHEGKTVDLVPHIAARKDELVLKPNDDYGGAGVVLGWEATPEVWQATIQRALEHPYIVQQRIELPSEPYPTYVDGSVVYADRITDTAPYCFDGAVVDGCLSRISSASLVNVTAGGGSTVPTFVVDPRS